jgi:uncharacterized protein Yka (UPF0111/DUF47 family)
MAWEDTRSRRAAHLGDDGFFLSVGTFDAKDSDELARFLEHLGSRLVFLIDWNRARKQLRSFVTKPVSVALLAWAAENDLGHRAFLVLGGAQLVYDAMAAVMRTPFRFGERLDDALGEEQAAEWLRFVLRESAEGVLAGRSHSLVRERIRAELASAFQTSGERLLRPAERHAEIVRGLATMIRARLERGDGWPSDADAREAKTREHEADEVVVEVRSLVERIPDTAAFRRIVEAADDAADELEEAVFAATLLPTPSSIGEKARGAMRTLAELVSGATEAYAAAVRAARHVRRGSADDETRALLEAVDRVVTIERDADDAERQAIAELVTAAAPDARVLFVATELVRHLETATDALLHAALVLRDHALGAVMVERD